MDQLDARNLATGTFRSALRLADTIDDLLQRRCTRDDAERRARTVLQNVELATRNWCDAIAEDVLELIHQFGNSIRSQPDIGLLEANAVRTLAQDGLNLLGADEEPPPVVENEESPRTFVEVQRQCVELTDFLASHDNLSEHSFGLT